MNRFVDFEIIRDNHKRGTWGIAVWRHKTEGCTKIPGCSLADLAALQHQISAVLGQHEWHEIFGSTKPKRWQPSSE